MTVEEFVEFFNSVGWKLPAREQMEFAIKNSTKSFVVRRKGTAAATISWLGDYGMHWFMKDLIVHEKYQGQMMGTLLYRFVENFIKSTLKDNQKVCIDLRAAKGKEPFYQSLGFQIMSENETGSGMEKMIER